eukprot:Lankesteria_metandrocarpae@DN2735_c0_g1_i2.p1
MGIRRVVHSTTTDSTCYDSSSNCSGDDDDDTADSGATPTGLLVPRQPLRSLILRSLMTSLSKMFFLDEMGTCPYPILRGKVHLLLVYLAPVWIMCLLRSAQSTRALVSASVACACGFLNFAASAFLHNISWKQDRYRFVAKRFDYAMIFFMIAGSSAPVYSLLLDNILLPVTMLWVACMAGAMLALLGYLASHKVLRTCLFVFLGLTNALFVPKYFYVTTKFEMVCLVLLGVFYVGGAVVYVTRVPNPSPKIFGFHEVFHVCCLLSFACTFLLNMSVLNRSKL